MIKESEMGRDLVIQTAEKKSEILSKKAIVDEVADMREKEKAHREKINRLR